MNIRFGILIGGWAVFLAAIIAGQLINQRAIARLTDDEKLRLINSCTPRRIWRFAWFFVFILLASLLYFVTPTSFLPFVVTTHLGVFLILVLVFGLNDWRHIKSLGFPEQYEKSVGLALLLQYGALTLLLCAFFTQAAFWSL